MYVCARFHEIPAKGLQDIKETKCYGWTDGDPDGRTDGQRENSIPPYNFIIAGGINILFVTLCESSLLFYIDMFNRLLCRFFFWWGVFTKIA